MAQAHTISPRTVQLRFQQQLGYSAKAMMRFVRFKKVVAHLLENPAAPPDWSDLVLNYGYHDQPHLIRDFQFYTGLSPSAFMMQVKQQALCISQPGKFY
ncbi:helix-turn-helix domain-containing protein [Rudanella paleaurantiibacter]|uniref:helix-turn-helix domain-containing protein n=1 Tax=Rudanella paleaurantiibacter TaxID=2614655 RepID=UPI0021D24B8F|nr:helix-turn-helix domain-containing protein [Rudanella paleaurantiibacter]